jgi:NTP-dependent ternary system trypsin peptidase co-occuring protein
MVYLSFPDDDGSSVLVEVSVEEIEPSAGVVKAGVGDRLRGAVAAASNSLEGALSTVIRANTRAFLGAVDTLPEAPDQIEIAFAIKATGELSNLAVGKLGGEANYSVTLTWTGRGRPADSG